MNKNQALKIISSAGKTLKNSAVKNAPTLLLVSSVCGGIATIILTIRSTVEAVEACKKLEEKKAESGEVPTKTEYVKTAAKYYIPPAITALLSTASAVAGGSIGHKRNKSLAASYALSEMALRNYQEGVNETFGKKAEQKIYDSMAAKDVETHPVSEENLIFTGKGDTLCRDSISNIYFKSDIESIRRSINDLNRMMRDENYISLNQYYYELHLPYNDSIGEYLGWNIERGYIEPRFSSALTDKGTPCLVLNFIDPPYAGYQYL